MPTPLSSEISRLRSRLESLGRAAVACSGGVDSTYLLAEALDVLGQGDVLAVLVDHPLMPQGDVDRARATVDSMGARLLMLEMDPLGIPEVAANAPDRCYHCKKEIFGRIVAEAARLGFHHVLDGTNADDIGVYRPGIRALEELGVLSPLEDSGLGKAMIRHQSRLRGLDTADRPAAPCLATRFPYDTSLDLGELAMADRAEQFIRELGFREVRVRVRESRAVIEVEPQGVDRLSGDDILPRVISELEALGFNMITVDPRGYRSGAMDEDMTNVTDKRS